MVWPACLVLLLAVPAVAGDWDSLYGDGVKALERREYEKAAALLERADQCLAEGAPLGHLVDTKLALGTAYTEQGRSGAALEQFLDGRHQIRARLGPLHPSSQILTLRAGMEAIRLSRLPEAESLLCACLESVQLAPDLGPVPRAPDREPMRRWCLSQLATLAARRGNFQLAQDLALLSIEGSKRRPGDGQAVASVLTTLGEVALEAADYQAAVMALRRAIAVWEQADPPDPGFSRVMRASLARALAAVGDRKAASDILDALLPSVESESGYTVNVARATAVAALLEVGRAGQARKMIDRLRQTAWSKLGTRERALVSLSAGRMEAQSGNDEAAATCFRDALQLLSEGQAHCLLAGHAHFGLATTLSRLGHLEESVRHAEHGLKILWRGLGRDHSLVVKAIKTYQGLATQAERAGAEVRRLSWLDFDERDAAEYERLRQESSKAARHSHWDTALMLLDRAIALAPWKGAALADRAQLKHRSRDEAGAIEDLTNAIASDFRPEFLARRARIRWGNKEHGGAIADATVSIEFDAESATCWMVRSVCHLARVEFDLAARNASRVTDGKDLAYAKLVEVSALLAMRKPERAGAVSDKNLSKSSKGAIALFYAARALAQLGLGRLEDAVADCTAALRADPTKRDPLLLRGIVQQEAGNWEGADRDLKAYLSKEPASLRCFVYLAYGVWHRDGRVAAGRFLAKPIRDDESGGPWLAVARCIAGQTAAKDLLGRAQASPPRQTCLLRYHAGRIQEMLGDHEGAVSSFKQAIEAEYPVSAEYWAAFSRTRG